MELDELKASWQRLDQRAQTLAAINRQLSIDAAGRKARWQLAPLIMNAAVSAIIGAVFSVSSAVYIRNHLNSRPALFAGGFLLVMSLAFFLIHAKRLNLARRVDFSRPVLEIQRSLVSLQTWEARAVRAVWVVCCVLPLGVMIAVAFTMNGGLIWQRAPAYLLANVVVWLAFGLGPLLLYRVSRNRKGRLAARMDAFLHSQSIADARAALEEIDDFAGP